MLDLEKLRNRIAAIVASGKSQTEVATAAGMTKQQLTNILSGRPRTGNLKLDTLDKLASAIELPARDLIK